MKEIFSHNRPDKLLLIDAPADALVLVPGEYAIVRFDGVEDVRADPTVLDSLRFGTVTLTNLRLAWNSRGDPNGHSISVGLSTITKISVGNLHRDRQQKVAGLEESVPPDNGLFITGNRSVVLHATFNQLGYKFELKPSSREFTQQNSNFFNILQAVYRAHDTTRMYRRVRVRSSIVRDGQPILLSREVILSSISNIGLVSAIGVSNVLGVFVRTSHRIIWFSPANESYNVSIPYVDVLSLSLKEIKGSDDKLLVFSIPANDNMKEFLSPCNELDRKTLRAKEHRGKGLSSYSIATFAFDVQKATPSVPIQSLAQSVLISIQKAQAQPDYGVEIKAQGSVDEASALVSSEQSPGGFGVQAGVEVVKTGPQTNSKDGSKVLKIIQAVASRTNFAARYIVSSSCAPGHVDGKDGGSGKLTMTLDDVLGVAFQSVPGIDSIGDLWSL
ncbi:Basal body protein, BBS5 [Giardia duodenalis]|uniref:BBSome complex member BBS5 homolog n=1 Tax=Giardia intestinalis (strain ATCC 50803 / WB clone C6) TaxID=184922 RepID=BBS5_GIAIC|nr:Basal body protein, BBS5 [Giardia intestinalis]A8B5V9.1 RecName: Full=Bardet-Biedl syndrome 5 protein homolog; AltName: Full=BBSome homolog BBS5; AltName: Full=Basal body protein; AltName: Full=Basal body protein, BBS5 [Giardia lamblia ATCC 50803]KAE8305095.1 Basal body protein, BBS5 [Giardia intestinalis]|eukprot:XP_001709316.1 Basal body protein [Giardia lamblia ATCC 50803]